MPHANPHSHRVMPQQPGIVAAWSDNGSVRVYDVTAQLKELAGETEPKPKAAQAKVAPLQSHAHATEGFALDWSPAKAGRLATGDCRKSLHVWEPQEGGRWQVGSAAVAADGVSVCIVTLWQCRGEGLVFSAWLRFRMGCLAACRTTPHSKWLTAGLSMPPSTHQFCRTVPNCNCN